MDLPLSGNQITLFAVSEKIMELFLVQQNLFEMVKSGYLEKFQSNNVTRYNVTEEGSKVLEYFEKQIPQEKRNAVNKYVNENRKVAKKDYDIVASQIFDYNNNEYLIRCGVYEDEAMLMEVNLYVVSKDQARLVCRNWKENVRHLYAGILSLLINPPDGYENNDPS